MVEMTVAMMIRYHLEERYSLYLMFWLIIKGLKTVEASIGGLLGLLEIVVSILLGTLLFREPLTVRVVVGGMLIVIAAALPHVWDLAKRRTA